MLTRFIAATRKLLSPQRFSGDSRQSRRARILDSVLLGLGLALALQFLMAWLVQRTPFVGLVPLMLAIPLLVLLHTRIRPEWARLQSIVLVVGLFILMYTQAFPSGGVRSPAYSALTILVLLTGLLLGFRAGIIVAAASILGGVVLVVLERNQSLAPVDPGAGTISFFISSISFMGIALTTLYLAVRDRHEASLGEESAIEAQLEMLDELQQSETRYRAIVEAQTDLINRHSIDGTIIYVNEAYAHFYHHSPEEMIGQLLSDFIPEAAWTQLKQILSELTPEQPVVTSEHLITAEDGREVWLQWSDRLILDQNGKPVEFQGIGRDITLIKLAERELQESEEKFRTLAEKSPNMIFINQGGRLIYVNEACITEMGYSKNEYYSPDFSFLTLISPDSREEIRGYFASHQAGHEVPAYEAKLVTRQGRLIHAIHSTRLININGQPAILGVITDVTERRQAEDALARLKKAVEASGEVIFITDPEGVFTYVNPEFSATYGYEPEDVIGIETPRILKSGVMSPDFYEEFWTKILNHQVVRAEMVNRTRDGELLTVEASINPIINERGELLGFLAAQRDVTERAQMQEALRQREEQYRAVAESAFIGIGITDPEEVFTYANPTLAQLLGCTPEELIGVSLEKFVSPQAFKLIREETRTRRMAGERDQYELRMRRVDGEELLMQVSTAPLFGAGGEFQGSLGVISDITSRRQAEDELTRQLAELTTLQQVANAAAGSLDEHPMIERCTQIIANTFYPDHVGVLLFDPERQALVVHPAYHGIPDPNYLDVIPIGRGITGTVVKDRKALRIGDVSKFPGFRMSTPGIRSELCVPLITGGNVIGVINAESRQADFFSEHDERLMLTIADLLATSIENARLFSLANEQRNLAEALRESAMAVNNTLNFDVVLERILNSLVRVVPHDCANIMTLDTDGRTLQIIAARGYDQFGIDKDKLNAIRFDLQSSQHFLGIMQTHEPRIIANVAEFEGWIPIEGMEWQSSYVCAPIIVEETVIGFVNLDSSQTDFFQQHHADWLQAFANQAGIAIENATLYQELERHSQFLEQAVAEATEELRDSRDRIETILANSPDAVLLLSPDGMIELANEACSRLFGFPAGEVIGQMLCLLAAPSRMEQCNDALKQVVEDARTFRFETVGARKDGTEFDIDLALAPVQRDGTVTGVVCSMRDISEFKRVGRMKDAFVSNVSHELRTPITSLKLNHSLLKMNPKNGAVYLDRLEREISRLNLLIEDLLRLSRLEQGQVQLHNTVHDLNEVAREYATDRMVIANDRQLSLFFEPSAEHALVNGDPGLIGQALSVLITNALNYTPAGGQVIVSTVEQHDSGQRWNGIRVSDNGAGISTEDMPYIFDRFYRGETGLTSGTPGTGLGLAIAQQIVHEQGGKIELSSKSGSDSGSEFTIWFPAAPADALTGPDLKAEQHA